MKHVPNIFTLLNLFFGCLAIVLLLQTDFVAVYQVGVDAAGERSAEFYAHNTPPQIWWASLFIALAALVDVLDGAVARFFNATSELGKQLDSLSDVVSFGVAPAMIFYQFMRMALVTQPNGIDIDIAYAFPAFILACAAAYRLARFNIDNHQQTAFRGVPTPMVGLFAASLPMIYWYAPIPTIQTWLHQIWFLYSLVLALSLLMLVNLPMMSLKLKSFKMADNIHILTLFAIVLVTAFLLSWLAIPVIFVSYIVLSLIFKNKLS